MSYDPSITQKVKVSGDTDRHRLSDMMWKAIENHDEACADFETRIAVIERTRPTKDKAAEMMDAKIKHFDTRVEDLKTLVWRAVIAIALMLVVDRWIPRH